MAWDYGRRSIMVGVETFPLRSTYPFTLTLPSLAFFLIYIVDSVHNMRLRLIRFFSSRDTRRSHRKRYRPHRESVPVYLPLER